MHLEPLCLNFLLPPLVVNLHVVQDSIDKCAYVWVLVTQKLENDRYHLSLMQHDFSSWPEKQEFKESV